MAHARAARSRIVEIAWKDRTPLEAIEAEYGLNEAAVIIFIRTHLKHRTFKRWRKRVSGRETKHLPIRNPSVSREHCSAQYKLKPSKAVKGRKA